jgi:transcriptional regulator with XRE-family HTH domain
MSSLGQVLRELRKKKGVSIKTMAPEVSIDHTYISKIENGYVVPSIEVVKRLANYFHYDKDELLVLSDHIPDDIREILKTRPKEALDYLRERFGKGGQD